MPSSRDLPDPGIKPASLAPPTLQVNSLLLQHLGSPRIHWKKVKVKVAQSCLTLCDPKYYTVQGILQARILEWVAFPFSRGSSQPKDQTQVFHIAGRFFTSWATREAHKHAYNLPKQSISTLKSCNLTRPILTLSGDWFIWNFNLLIVLLIKLMSVKPKPPYIWQSFKDLK